MRKEEIERGQPLQSFIETNFDGDKVSAALKLVAASVSPAEAARQLGIWRSTGR